MSELEQYAGYDDLNGVISEIYKQELLAELFGLKELRTMVLCSSLHVAVLDNQPIERLISN